MQSVGILRNPQKEKSIAVLEELQSYFSKKDVNLTELSSQNIRELLPQLDLIITLGGDGTLLQLSKYYECQMPPVLAVNLGSLGFITDIKTEEMISELDIFMSGKAHIEQRFMVEVMVESKSGKVKEINKRALNDVVIHRENLSPFMKLTFEVNDNLVYSVSGDGVIIATPTGSTAYNLSANGPIVPPPAENIIVTPICHHSLIQKSIVLSPQETVAITISSRSHDCPAKLLLDGSSVHEIEEGDRIVIKGSDKHFPLIRHSKRSYFDVLKEKFNWVE